MATVTPYTTQTEPSNIPLPRVNIQTNPNMFGAQVGAATQHSGEAAQAAAKDTLDTERQLMQLQQETKARETSVEWVNKRIDSEDKFLQLHGQDAVDALPGYRTEMQESMKDTAEGLPPYARRAFLNNASQYSYRFQQMAVRHSATQGLKVATDTDDKVVLTQMREAGKYINDPDGLGRSYAIADAAMQHKGDLLGWSEDEIGAAKATARGKLQTEVLKTTINHNPLRALREIDDGKYDAVESSQLAVYQARAQRNATLGRVVTGQAPAAEHTYDVSDFLRHQEGLKLSPYQDSGGLTVGYGHQLQPGEATGPITQDQAESYLKSDIATAQGSVDKNVTVPMTAGQRDAMTSLAFNMGVGNFEKSSVLKKINEGKYSEASAEFAKYNHSEGKENPVLTKRRQEEQDLFNKADTSQQIANAHGNPMAQYEIAQLGVALNTPAENAKLLETMKDPVAHERIVQAMQYRDTKLQQDPAGYLFEQNPDLELRVKAGWKDPVQMGQAVKEADMMYDRIGVPLENRSLLSKSQAENVADGLTMGGIKKAVQWVDQIKGNFGEDIFHRVYKDVMTRAELPTSVQTAAVIDTPLMRNVLARAYSMTNAQGEPDIKEFEKLLPDYKQAQKDVDAVLQGNEWKNFVKTLGPSGVTNPQIAGYEDAARRMSYQLMLEGDSTSSAANKAVKAFTDQFTIIESARVPKEVSSAVSDNASTTLKTLSPDMLQIPFEHTDADTQQSYLIGLKSSGRWITNQDGSGMVRQDSDGRLVRKKDGSILTIPFSWPARGSAAQ